MLKTSLPNQKQFLWLTVASYAVTYCTSSLLTRGTLYKLSTSDFGILPIILENLIEDFPHTIFLNVTYGFIEFLGHKTNFLI